MAKSKEWGILLGVAWMLWINPAQAEHEPQPYPPDALLKGILDFREPTGIRGRLLYTDGKKQIIWLEWAQVPVEETPSRTSWQRVPNEWTIAVHPLNQSQFYILQQMSQGTALEMVIQLDQEGIRRILSFEELALIPKVDSMFPFSAGENRQ